MWKLQGKSGVEGPFAVLVTVENLETFNNFKTMALKLSRDVKLPSEPSKIIRSVQGSFI